jgi:nitrogen fixation/metabolism regulation signal transduction histidine kinase
MRDFGRNLFIQENKWYNNFKLQQAFAPVEWNGKNVAYLSVLQVDDQRVKDSGVNEFMGTLLNVYVFLFLIAGAIAIAIANSITRPLSVLGDKLKQLKLDKTNEPLKWDNQDELGDLINDYNVMIEKLEESAQLLAITERDTAWREMARQVAHEIKNPLTPMQLSIQHLQNTMRRNPDADIKPIVDRVAKTLLEQIKNLSLIAGEFSNFAKMPQARNEKVILNEIVSSAHDLFRKRDDMDINLYIPIDEIYVFADHNQLVRVLNNLVKNAIQAIPTDRRGRVDILLYKEEGKAIIKISDNGSGIAEDMKEKVFRPNFTTKTSGTGLGLAICSSIIESFNGKIYFETKENVGTQFYVEIPLMRLEDNFREEERVSL